MQPNLSPPLLGRQLSPGPAAGAILLVVASFLGSLPQSVGAHTSLANGQSQPEERTINSKTTLLGILPDGRRRYAFDTSVGPIHYKDDLNDPDEPWKAIDTSIELSDQPGYQFQNRKNFFKSYFREHSRAEDLVKYQSGDSFIAYTLTDNELGPLQGTVGYPEENMFVYPHAYSGVDVQYSVSSERLLEEFVLHSYRPVERLSQQIHFEGAYFAPREDGSYQFYDSQTNEELWTIARPVMYELGDLDTRSYGLHYELSCTQIASHQGNTCTLVKVLDEEGKAWLADEARNFPLVIDATVDRDIAAGSDDYGQFYGLAGSRIMFGGVSGYSPNYGQGFRFTNITIPRGSTVTSAYISIVDDAGSWINIAVRLTAIDEDNTATFSAGNVPGSRPITSSYIAVEIPNVSRAAGERVIYPTTLARQQTLGAAINAVVNRPGWSSGNAIAVVNNSDQDPGAVVDFSRTEYRAYESGSPATNGPKLHIEYTLPPTLRYSSIGTNAGNLHAVGMASVPIGSTTVTFTSPLPAQTAVGAVGTGDVLDIEGEILLIAAYDSPTQVTLQSAATVDHSTPTSTFTVTRAFNSLQAWETARGGNLVGENRLEVGVAYKDGPFAELLSIDGSTTDATHFMRLTVAQGQRHNGTAETGVVLDGQSADRMGIEVLDDYTVVEWFDLKNHHGPTGYPGIRVEAATNVLFQFLLVRDFYDATGNSEGIAMRQGQVNGMTVRNCFIFNGDAVGIEGDDGDDTLVIENVTIYNMDGNGVDEKNGTLISATNTISMGNGGIDFDMPSGTQSYNMSEDGTASCGTCKGTENPLIQFQTVGSDFHLAATSTALDAGTDLSGSFCCDIDAETRPGGALWDMGADERGAVTAVTLASLEAAGEDGAVQLSWTTASELDNLGFHLYRATVASGPYERINARLIPGLGSSPAGAGYTYRDGGLTNGKTYYYKLEDVDASGATDWHGPVSATPQLGAPSPGDDETTLITYGQPASNTLRVTERGRLGVTLELTTEAFLAEPLEDGAVRLEIPGFDTLSETSAPGIPVRRAWVEAVAGRKVEIQSVRLQDVETFSSLRPAGADVPDLVALRDGTVRARRRRRSSRKLLERMYPDEAARVTSVGFQGDVKKALVELAPLRWDGATGQLILARRLVVHLSFREPDLSESTKDGLHGKRRQRRRPSTEGIVARLHAVKPGLCAVRFEELFGPRGRALQASTLRLSRQGDTVAHHVEPPSDRFGPGSILYFVSEGAAANPYGDEAVYELGLAPGGKVMREGSASPSGHAVSFYWHTVRKEENRYYQAGLVDAPDLWLWELLFAPETKSFSFDTPDLVPAAEDAHLRVWLQGASDLPPALDHHVRLYLNGTLVGETHWDGKLAKMVDAELPPGILRENENALELESVGDTGAEYSMVMLDRFEVTYPRSLVARDGGLEGSFPASGVAEISGLGSGVLLLDTTTPDPRWLTGASAGADSLVRARVEAGARYLVVSPETLQHPEVTRFRPTGLRSESNGADYLIVAPEAFLSATSPLLELRAREGLRTKAVTMEDVDSEFGFGESTPEALKDFLSYAYHHWQGPSLRYVLLLGDATYDFKDYLGTGVRNRVPPLMVQTSFLWTASDPSLAAVNGDDILPDFAIGRLPAASLAEARVMVDKIVAYETGESSLTGAPIVLVADNPDGAGDFEADADAIAASTPARQDVHKLYLRTLGAAATRRAILQAFDDGASLVNYIGHGGIHLWASENILNIEDSASLTPQAQQPLLVTMNCLNGYFHFPYFNSLAEELLKAEDKGAIAAFSPTGLSLDEPAHLYHEALLRALFSGRHQRLGDAVLEAQESYTESGAYPELLSIYHLLGDPALRLR